jgi:hydrogenase maturation factor
MNLYVGRIVSVHQGGASRWGAVSVRGARAEVALDLVPGAQPGDSVLVHAGVALALLQGEETGAENEEGQSCA